MISQSPRASSRSEANARFSGFHRPWNLVQLLNILPARRILESQYEKSASFGTPSVKEVEDQIRTVYYESVEVNPMVFWIASVVGLSIAYFFGSTPTGYLAGKLLKGIDIREHGSKSTGATNVLRTLGKISSIGVLLVDVLKGVGAIVFARWFYHWFYTLPFVTPPTALDLQTWIAWAVCLAGLAALLGHSLSIWLNFTGRKSAATGLGVLLAMSWPVGLGAAIALVSESIEDCPDAV